MTKLASLLTSKIASKNLTLTAAASSAKVTFPSLRAVLDGRSAPNSRSIPKYAKFLGITEKQVVAAAGPRGGKKRGRPPGKVKGKRGRPRLPGVAKATIKLLKEGLASIQKRIDRMNKVIERIATN